MLWFKLSVFIHAFIIILVVTACDLIHPLLVVKIPADGLFYSLLELKRRFPSEFLVEFRRIDRITEVMSSPVSHISDKSKAVAFRIAQDSVDCSDDHLDEIDVLPFVETADIICFRDLSLMEDKVDGTGMVLDEKPVTDILSLSIYRKRLSMTYIIDK